METEVVVGDTPPEELKEIIVWRWSSYAGNQEELLTAVLSLDVGEFLDQSVR